MLFLGVRALDLLMACPVGLTPDGRVSRPGQALLGSASSLSPLGLGGRQATRPDAQRPGAGSVGQAWRPVREASAQCLPPAQMAPQKISKVETDRDGGE